MEKQCELAGCKNPSCGKEILVQNLPQNRQWKVEVCQKHYDTAHPSRKK